MYIKNSKTSAFTLIELLVVITIIAILAGIALPVFGQVKIRGDQTKALSNAKQIGTACKIYAVDYGGVYPAYTDLTNKTAAATGATSNSILQTLMPDYLPEKSIFAIGKSKFCTNVGSAAASAAPKVLGGLENEWAYVCGLTDTSYARWPLIADGFKSATDLTYDTDDSKVGGIWKGKKAIVIRCDGSGAVETLHRTSYWVKRIPEAADSATPGGSNAFTDAAGDPTWFTISATLFVTNPDASAAAAAP